MESLIKHLDLRNKLQVVAEIYYKQGQTLINIIIGKPVQVNIF